MSRGLVVPRLLIVFTFTMLIPATVATAVPVQWSPGSGGNGHYYDLVPTLLTWQQAKLAAESLTFGGAPGHLATITSAPEKDFLATAFGTPEAWLGGFQDHTAPDFAEPAGGWRWVTGETWSYTNWYPGLPDEFQNAHQDFLWTGAGGQPQWDDIQNDAVRGYFVEYVPEPAAIVPLAAVATLLRRRRAAT
jgi:hypothetical protein